MMPLIDGQGAITLLFPAEQSGIVRSLYRPSADVTTLIVRQPPDQVPGLVRRLFAICAEAQGHAASLAIAAAQGATCSDAELAHGEARVAAETCREHALRISFDWTSVLGEPKDSDLARSFVDAMGETNARLLDTRKTIPGLRMLEKYAVRTGGGHNHRMGLWDAAMIKDNHVAVAGGVGEAVRRALGAGVRDVICEVDRLDQIEPALEAGATRLLLDNMAPDMLRAALAIVAGRVPCEASGGVRLDTIAAIAATGVDYISVGRLTQSAPAADIGLDFTPL